MLELSAVLYIFIAVYTAGLLSPFLTSERAQVTAVTSVYRPIGLSLVIVHCITAYLSSFHFTVGVVANASYILALVVISQELKFEGKKIFGPNPFLKIFWLGLMIFGLIFFGRLLLGSGREYASLIILLALGAELRLISVIHKSVHQPKSIYLLQAMFAAVLAAGIMVIRLVAVNTQAVFSPSVGDESGFLLALRLLNAASFFVLLNGITNFQFQKLWSKERELRVDAERQSLDSLIAISHAQDTETGNRTLRKRRYVQALVDNLKPKNWFTIPDPEVHMEQFFSDDLSAYPNKSAIDGPNEAAEGLGQEGHLRNDSTAQTAQVMAVAEVYEALTSRQPGKRSWTHKQAIAEITGMAGSRLDPTVVKAFLEEEATFSAVTHTWRDDP